MFDFGRLLLMLLPTTFVSTPGVSSRVLIPCPCVPLVTNKVDCKDKCGYTPLHLAAMHDHADAIRVLLEAGVSFQGCDNFRFPQSCVGPHVRAGAARLARLFRATRAHTYYHL